MRILYHVDELGEIINALSLLTNISLAIVDTEYRTVLSKLDHPNEAFCRKIQQTEYGIEKCRHSDYDLLKQAERERRPVSHICHAGVLDAAVPIFQSGKIVGFIVLGRIRLKGNRCSLKEELKWAENPKQLQRDYQKLTCMSEQQLSGLIHLVSNLLFDHAIEIKYDELIDFATDYIEHNLSDDLTVFALCKKLNTSKNPLYRSFRDSYHCTVNEYVTARRMKRAKELLCHTAEPVEQIARAVGYDNHTYFCKIFKRQNGISPRESRKKNLSPR